MGLGAGTGPRLAQSDRREALTFDGGGGEISLSLLDLIKERDIHLAAACDCQLPYNHEGNQPSNVTEAEDSSVETGKTPASLGMVSSD